MLNPVRHLLAGLKLFYRIARAHGYYSYDNPLSGVFTEVAETVRGYLIQEEGLSPRPKMPDQSGVDEPSRARRLTDSYFLLKDKWVPRS
jgi:hypothetical protein